MQELNQLSLLSSPTPECSPEQPSGGRMSVGVLGGTARVAPSRSKVRGLCTGRGPARPSPSAWHAAHSRCSGNTVGHTSISPGLSETGGCGDLGRKGWLSRPGALTLPGWVGLGTLSPHPTPPPPIGPVWPPPHGGGEPCGLAGAPLQRAWLIGTSQECEAHRQGERPGELQGAGAQGSPRPPKPPPGPE